MPLINCEINLILSWSPNCIISNAAANQNTKFAITDTKFYVPVKTICSFMFHVFMKHMFMEQTLCSFMFHKKLYVPLCSIYQLKIMQNSCNN